MYQLTIRGPDGSEVSYWLGPDQGLVLGTEETCDVVLSSRRVSGRHARFYTLGDQLHVEDLDSQAGTFVGGARISGISEIRPGPAIEIGEYKVMLARAEPPRAEQGPAIAAPKLRGVGPTAGRELVLPAKAVFGRDRGVDIPLGDDSVSRRHAELRRDGAAFFLKDLGSSNGTFVNGKRLPPNEERALRRSDKVRFGDTQWVFEGGPAAAAPEGKNRLALVAVGAVVVLAVVIAVSASGPGEIYVEEDEEASILEQAEEQLALGQQAYESDRFEESRRHFQKALYVDPINIDARMAGRRAARELEFERLFKEATGKSELGRDEEALQLFFRIESDSRFFARARLKVQELAGILMRRDAQVCREAGRSRSLDGALEACARYLDYSCHKETDQAMLKILRDAEAKAGRKGEWSCPAHLAVWFGTGPSSSAEAVRAVTARYTDKDVREAMLAYLKGEVDAAQRQLLKKRKDPVAAELLESLAIIDGRYREGQAAFLKGSLKDAERAFGIALERDGRLMPEPVTSFLAGQMRSMLAKGFFEVGNQYFEKERLAEAFEQWSRGLTYQRTDGRLRGGLDRLERVANGLLNGRPDCEDLQRALRITVAEPPSSAHRRASDLFERDCRG